MKAVIENRDEILLPHMSAHTLRHTFCTRLCESTSDLKFIMSVMGHANKEITLGIYYHIHEKNLTDNFEKFSENTGWELFIQCYIFVVDYTGITNIIML